MIYFLSIWNFKSIERRVLYRKRFKALKKLARRLCGYKSVIVLNDLQKIFARQNLAKNTAIQRRPSRPPANSITICFSALSFIGMSSSVPGSPGTIPAPKTDSGVDRHRIANERTCRARAQMQISAKAKKREEAMLSK